VDEQSVDNARAAAAEGWDIVETWADNDRSASRYATKARENYAQVLDAIASHRIDVLILWEPSRGSRRVSEWVTLIELCEQHRVRLHVTSHARTYDPANPRDRRSILEDAVDSEYESGRTSTRMKRTTAAAAEAGRPFGAVPFGYRREYEAGSASPVRQVRCETTGPIVEELVARILAGDPLHKIAVDFNARGVPTPQMMRDRRTGTTGKARGGWSNPKIRAVLRSPTLAGWRVHQGQRVGKAQWEPLVSDADLAAVHAILDDPARRTQRGTEARHLLSGLVECGVCGGWLRAWRNRGHPSYTCAGVNNTTAGHVVRRAAPLEAAVTAAMIATLSGSQFLPKLAASQAEQRDQAAEVAAEIVALQDQIREFETAAITGGAAAASFGRVIEGLHARLAEAQARVGRVSGVPASVLALAGENAAEEWDAAGLELQRLAIRSLMRVVVHKSSTRVGFDASTVEITARRG
jgi:site-specific DNA recombinase